MIDSFLTSSCYDVVVKQINLKLTSMNRYDLDRIGRIVSGRQFGNALRG